MKDAKHPIWAIIRLVVYMTALFGILYITASDFDDTETRTIIVMFLVVSAGEGAHQFLSRFYGGK